jgi:hypothetical protein
VRKARAEVAAYAECTESQMMAMFGWTDPKMPAHYIAKANREKARHERHGQDGGVRPAPERGQLSTPLPDANKVATNGENKVVTCVVIFGEKLRNFNYLSVGMVRSEGLEPPRFYSLPPQGSASTNSATSA